MKLLDGKEVAKKIRAEVATDVLKFKKKFNKSPQLAVISIGDDPASKIYLKHKEKAALEAGMQFLRFELDKKHSLEELDSLIIRLNSDSDVHGILVQLPIPEPFKIERVLEKLNPMKDADGFHPENLGLLMSGNPRVKPCTPYGIMKIFEHYDINVAGKHAVVVGRSNIVGKPMAQLLLAADSTVTQCHSKTIGLSQFTKEADIVVAAIGKAKYLNGTFFNRSSIVVDVGIHHLDGKICGDVDFDDCSNKVAAITPVPGGVGPMTVAMLLRNTIDLAFLQQSSKGV